MSQQTEPVYMQWARARFGDELSRPVESPILPLTPAKDRHPALAAMPPELRLTVYRRGRLLDFQPGGVVHDAQGVLFVLSGAIGIFPGDGSGVCLRLAGPGAVVNAEDIAGAASDRTARVLVKGAGLALRGAILAEVLGERRADQLLIEQGLAEKAALDREVACNALHLAPARLARRLLQLHRAARGADIHITQSELAQMLGVQRTSVNAAAKALQDRGALRFVRGRVRILDADEVAQASCACVTSDE